MDGRRHIIRYHAMAMACMQGVISLQENKEPALVVAYPGLSARAYLSDKIKGDEVKAHAGLEIILVFEGDRKADNIMDISRGIVGQLMDHVSFITSAQCETPRMESYIIIEDNNKGTGSFYSQSGIEPEITIGTPNKIDKAFFTAFENAFDNSEHKDRISRSLAWFRKGIGEKLILDQFISFWVSIEVIKHILRRKLQWRFREPQEWDGVKHILKSKVPSVNFDDLFTARQEILHGYAEISPMFIARIRSYIDPMKKAVIYCIGSILDLKDDDVDKIAGFAQRRFFMDYTIGLKGVFENLPNDIDKLFERYPEMTIKIKLRDYQLRDKKIDYNFDTSYIAKLPEKTTFVATALELEGEKDAGILGFSGEIHN